MHSSDDLVPIRGLGKDMIRKIEEALTAAGLQLARFPRSNCREVYFSAASINARDVEFARRK